MTELREQLQASLGTAYSVERELGGGGMSRVFVAQETSLRRTVVVKLLPPELAGGVNVERFRREIAVAAQLQHSCIVPLLAAGAVEDMPYFTMPFIEGESLRKRIARDGALPVADTVKILRDIAEALSYAHERGVVHRDIKPDNILLGKHHALVTDFGVAKALSASTHAEGLTAVGIALGTPAYMAPEQGAGDAQVDHRADLYAFGATAYEMLSGSPPFSGRTAQAQLAAHAVQTPTPITQLRPAVPEALASIIAQCLEKNPADRPQSADDILQSLDTIPTVSGPVAVRTPAGVVKRHRLAFAAAGLTLIAVAIGGAFIIARSHAPKLNPRRVVIADLDNETGDPKLASLGRMTAEWLSRGLEETGQIEVAYTNSAGADPGANASQKLTGIAEANAVAQSTRAGTVVWGAVYRQGDSLRFQMQATDANSGKLIRSFDPVVAPVADPQQGLVTLRRTITGALGTLFDQRVATYIGAHDALPNYAAYQELAEGGDAFVRGNFPDAVGHYAHAIELDSTMVTTYMAIASSLWNIGQWARLDSLGRVVAAVRDRRTDLTPSQQDAIEWVIAAASHDLSGELRIADRMAARDSVDVMLFLVGVYHLGANQPTIAVATFKREHDAERPSGWFGYWVPLVNALHMRGDYRTALAEADRSVQLNPKLVGATRLRAINLAALGRTSDALKIVDSLRLLGAGGIEVGSPLTDIGVELRAHGHPDEARKAFDAAVAVYRVQATNGHPAPAARLGLAAALYNLERWDEARALCDSLSRTASPSVAVTGLLGVIDASRGDRAGAMHADSLLAATQQPYLFGANTAWRARIAGASGNADQAVALLRQSMTEDRWFDVSYHAEKPFEKIRGTAVFQEFLKPKG